ncbi:MAG: PEP-CTERM sorting domain-containing protein [Woeseiaceae bacterium]|nr:PEP-CTERM sorting domain-containing protein [Woeseiaceae bacterium]
MNVAFYYVECLFFLGMSPMTRIKNACMALIVVLLSSTVANADPIQFVFEGTSTSGWNAVGVFVLDDSDLIAGNNLVSAFTSWSFTWTNGIDTLTNDDSNNSLLPYGSIFVVDDLFNVITVDMCSDVCNGVGEDWPEFFVGLDGWNASITPEGECCVAIDEFPTGSWSNAMSVPEPGTLALLGIGLVGLGLRRRSKKA